MAAGELQQDSRRERGRAAASKELDGVLQVDFHVYCKHHGSIALVSGPVERLEPPGANLRRYERAVAPCGDTRIVRLSPRQADQGVDTVVARPGEASRQT